MQEHEGHAGEVEYDGPAFAPPWELAAELRRRCVQLDETTRWVLRLAREHAVKEDAYRMARAKLILEAGETLRARHGFAKPSEEEKKAYVDLRTSKERREAHEAENLLRAGHQAIQSQRAQLSAWQSMAGVSKAEAELAGKGPN